MKHSFAHIDLTLGRRNIVANIPSCKTECLQKKLFSLKCNVEMLPSSFALVLRPIGVAVVFNIKVKAGAEMEAFVCTVNK